MNATEARVLSGFKTHGSLTVKECGNLCGTTELRSIRCKLEKKGYSFGWIWEDHENGKHKRYFLRSEPNG